MEIEDVKGPQISGERNMEEEDNNDHGIVGQVLEEFSLPDDVTITKE